MFFQDMEKQQAKDQDGEMAYAMFIIEKELGCHIDEDYPYLKFMSELESLKRYREEEKKAYERAKRR